ncbi:hypothetical protein QBC38DRAFT_373221 [Podospora fimiseda]|uniref:Uncharacterized protein n=1 Tax=Podospora fimiseda TaxID=252190 RepID=A0AAN7GNW6_9PEZI|nr:hypothetical protein QBC38DRAFT_373221 [Podospora fimiseda]
MANRFRSDNDSGHGAMGIADKVGQPGDLRCCCGKEECVYLRHNCSVLLSVERDVHAAAKMGQVSLARQHSFRLSRSNEVTSKDYVPPLTFALQTLLARHEAYMASAERERAELTARIEQLEAENAELESKNRRVNDENYSLREELDHLNDTVRDADTKIEFLEATLRDTQREVRRLEHAAERAASLERQIQLLEEAQQTLQATVVRTKEEARSTMHRWRQAERELAALQAQLERMEKEAKEERERHVEVVSRMERQRNMEKELNTAAGRLKGAAAVKSMTDSKAGGNVVSHFVRDLLQDNANLQIGMAELRELLVNSNDEIQMLREQLLYHQPADATHADPSNTTQDSESIKTLRAELEQVKSPPPQASVSQQLHVHHHYHVTHKPELKKVKKRRLGITSGTFTPPRTFSAPVSPMTVSWHRAALPASLATPTIGEEPENRWSTEEEHHSEFEPSSAPSSPRSNNRNSVFDRVGDFSSYPVSPTTTVDPTSPAWRGGHRKRPSEFSSRSIFETAMFAKEQHPHPLTNSVLCDNHSGHSRSSRYNTNHAPSYHDREDDSDISDTDAGDLMSRRSGRFDGRMPRSRKIRRVTSQESIMSLSNGLDIHTLQGRPSQLTLKPLGLSAAGVNISGITAQPTLSSGRLDGKRSTAFLRDSLNSGHLAMSKTRDAGRTVSTLNRNRDSVRQSNITRTSSALGKLVSWRPWGGGGASSQPSPETSPATTPALDPTTDLSSVPSSTASESSTSPHGTVSSSGGAGTFRNPGVNQRGVIPGFNEYWVAHIRRGPKGKVSVDNLEQIEEALREALEEEV